MFERKDKYIKALNILFPIYMIIVMDLKLRVKNFT